MDFLLWIDSLLYPEDTFRAESDNVSLRETLKHGAIAGFIYGGITGLLFEIFPHIHATDPFIEFIKDAVGNYFLLASIALFPLISLSLLFFISSILFISARILKKDYGDFLTQTHFLSSLIAALIMFSLLRFIVPFIGHLMVLFIFIYSLKPLIIALKQTHQYETKDALSTIALSSSIFLILLLISLGIFWHIGILISPDLKNTASGFRDIKIIPSMVKYHDHEGTLEFEVVNTLKKPIILTNLVLTGDCKGAKVDFDKNTQKWELFITLDPDQFAEIKVVNCTKKHIIKKFSVPISFQYQEKNVGKEVTHVDGGVIQGVVE
jgi:hypothetical protein